MSGQESSKATVLIVDDEPGICDVLARYLNGEGYRTIVACCGEEALRVASAEPPDVALVDLRLPGMDGLDLLRRFRAMLPRTKVVLITAYGGFETAVEASLGGAYDYVPKPLDLEHLGRVVSRAIAGARVALRPAPVATEPLLLGTSAAAARLREELDLAARDPTPLLLSGETGSGRLAAARRIHEWSPACADEFLPVRCAERPERLGKMLDDHAADRPGFRVLLDLEDLPGPRAARLFERGAGIVSRARLLAAVTCPAVATDERTVALAAMAHAAGWRLLRLPALRDRLEDLPDLAGACLARIASRTGRNVVGLDDEALELLGGVTWSGNLRQLENVLHSAALAARDGVLRRDCFAESLRGRRAGAGAKTT